MCLVKYFCLIPANSKVLILGEWLCYMPLFCVRIPDVFIFVWFYNKQNMLFELKLHTKNKNNIVKTLEVVIFSLRNL